MLQALAHRFAFASVPARDALRRVGAVARPAARAALFGALLLGSFLAAGLATLHAAAAAAATDHTGLVLAAWLGGAGLVFALPYAAAWGVVALMARLSR